MKESVARSYEIEEAKGGLVVRKALYGRLIGGSRYTTGVIGVLLAIKLVTGVGAKVSLKQQILRP